MRVKFFSLMLIASLISIIYLINYNIFLVILQIYLVYYAYDMYRKRAATEKVLDFLVKEHYDIIEKTKEFDHNIKNKLLAIESMTKKKYDMIKDDFLMCNMIGEKSLIFPDVPKSLSEILFMKLHKKEIIFNFFYSINKDKEFESLITEYKLYELIKVMAIAIDNALEATQNLKNPFLFIYLSETETHIVLEIVNNYNQEIDETKIGQKKYSTKGIGRGYGIFSIINNKSLNTKLEIKPEIFTVKINVSKKKLKEKRKNEK